MKKNKIENNNNTNDKSENINGFERKLSWSEVNSNNDNIEKKSSGKKIKTIINEDDERELELMLESGRCRSNRAMTIQKSSYNFGEVISNLRQRRERLAILNQKIKFNSGQIK